MSAARSGVTMMRGIRLARARTGLALGASTVLAFGLLAGSVRSPATAVASESTNRSGIACTTDPVGGTRPTFDLTTRAGYINLADGTTAYMWGFSEGSRPFQHPGPVLCVNEGDTVTVVLHNAFTATSP